MVHAFNPSTLEAEADESLSSWTVWLIENVPGQPGLHRETQINKREGRKDGRKEAKEERKRKKGQEKTK